RKSSSSSTGCSEWSHRHRYKIAGIQVIFLLIGLIPVISVSLLSFTNAKTNIETEAYKALGMYAGLTDAQISSFLSERGGDASVYVSSDNVTKAMNALRAANWDETDPLWLSLKNDLSRFSSILVDEFGYSFVFLTDVTGRAVYSSQEGVEGADLSVRDYVQTSLRGEMNWSDLFFSTIVNENTIVLSLPIRTNGLSGEIMGTANLVLTEDLLAKIVHEGVETLGKSADSYLINAQGLLLTDTLLGDFAQDASLKETIDTDVVRELSNAIENGNTDFHWQGIYIDYLGNQVLGSAEVMRLGTGYAGLVVEIDEDEAFAGVYAMKNRMLMILFVTIFLVAGTGYFIASNTAKPIISIADVAKQVAGGDFTVSTEIKRNDEIGQLGNAFNTMNENLRKLIRQAVLTATGVNEGSEALSTAVESVSASLEEVAASTNQFSSNTLEMSASSQEMAELSNQVATSAAEGSAAVDNAILQMQEINSMVEGLRNVIGALDKRSQDIGNIVGLITDVAEQTNLLALNAAIEAARAGEQGRGFAVVAEEVRKLAEQSRSAAEEIRKLVRETQEESSRAVTSMEKGVETVRSGSDVVLASGDTFKEIVKNVNSIVQKIEVVSSSAQEVSAGSEEIAASTEEQSSVMEEINASAEELRANADALIKELNRFKYN
ncbi:MAG: methyl-accepting chemotaxis protein, partial [Bacillota bacterium]|nr:methyl-accepting chemotaxis protein [Bacillota bacterium]